ncbi:hypothetical protein PXH78_33130 [Mycolicibacterium smegmatis]|uniref:DUF4926 domain-containing protein n=2 Tax=Mycolicibacterium smegmatis TaxID=1772 RepID=I7GER9_MYCS2|nr:hypothetical protein [Mycolicibacterium smegmatis]AFP42036.1 hypothetical protein MSMEI_5596 [Mycolicibacterium smegmatis MC2 155]MBE9642750.1 hypothetical protein [Mycolicibacterium smegmatis]MBE9655573.1 hypothetical protein [Mycolicibacterium smegmatis]MCP2624087.1 DUF4926 domain-containing protein [Mycolicibacterium smegmatis]MDF1903815.1 hypothetical protein [Mycolicibacterium smegmatis]
MEVMKARVNDSVELLVDVPGETQSWQIPKGTRGVVVEVFQHPVEGYAVDVSLPDASSSTKFRYDNVMLEPDQFIVVRSA